MQEQGQWQQTGTVSTAGGGWTDPVARPQAGRQETTSWWHCWLTCCSWKLSFPMSNSRKHGDGSRWSGQMVLFPSVASGWCWALLFALVNWMLLGCITWCFTVVRNVLSVFFGLSSKTKRQLSQPDVNGAIFEASRALSWQLGNLAANWLHQNPHACYRREKSIHQRCFQLWKLKCLNRQKRGLVYTKKLGFKKKEGKYISTKEPSRCLWGTPSRSIGV